MVEKFKKISNPLTIIAIFAGLAEVSGTTVLPFLDSGIQPTFVWFLIGFPTLLILLFFITLNFNSRVLYAPTDFRDEDNYLKTMSGFKDLNFENTMTEATIDNFQNVRGNIRLANKKRLTPKEQADVLSKIESLNFDESDKKSRNKFIVDNANAFFNKLLDFATNFFMNKVLESIHFSIQNKEYFLLEFKISKEYLKEENIANVYSVIINISYDSQEKLKFIAIGKDIVDDNPVEFADNVFKYVRDVVLNCIDKKHIE